MPQRKRPIRYADVAFGSTIFPLLVVGIFYGLDIWLSSSTILRYPLNLLGMFFIIPGAALASWCFNVIKTIPQKPTLVTWGPWAHVRHPIYLAGILVNLGVAVLIGTVILMLQSIGWAVIEILGDSLYEERDLRKSFPEEYEEYSRKVPRYIPRIG